MTRQDVEDFLYREAALLDAWQLDEWLELLTDDAQYRVPSNDAQGGDPKATLYLIADDIQRLRGRVTRLKDPQAHAEFPHSRTRRLITNVRIVSADDRPSYYLNIGASLQALGRLDLAIQTCRQAIALRRAYPEDAGSDGQADGCAADSGAR